ncbi:hypothetical protein [Flavobacterium sp.]|uniref:DUF6943 family protein n=1 Tax=Flavobacterium sp. TaxID=239 RepID=UPI002626B54D|nr:hypothetical protein [Flavobacterium sp.]
MQNLMIKSHKPNQMYFGDYIFILNKGLNSGKPMYEPCPNCFVLIFPNAEEKESYYWLSYSLWKAKFWHLHLVGSVIPFLRICDFKKEFDSKTRMMLQEQEEHLKSVKALRLLEQKEAQFHKNLALINDMKRVILYRYINKK